MKCGEPRTYYKDERVGWLNGVHRLTSPVHPMDGRNHPTGVKGYETEWEAEIPLVHTALRVLDWDDL